MEDVEVPNLPGYVSNDVEADNFSKSQLFDIIDGMSLVEPNKVELKPSCAPTIPTGHEFMGCRRDMGDPSMLNAKESVAKHVNALPKWILFDKAVLRFWAWTSEDVLFSNDEKIRYRHFRVLYYLEDDTLQISEERVENSGIEQGLFFKRELCPAHKEDRYMTWKDITVGEITMILGREFNFYKADEFTREFFMRMKQPIADDSEPPYDVFSLKRDAEKERPAPDTSISGYAEAIMGKTASWQFEQEKRFLSDDRKVLRFWAHWEDPQLFGQRHNFLVLYYISDDSMSIHEIYPENAGTFLFPTFLKRQQLPKALPERGVSLIGEDHDDVIEGGVFTYDDLKIGQYITVYGRQMLLTRCDEYTKCFYKDKMNMKDTDFEEILESNRDDAKPEIIPPPHKDYGTEEDSLGSVKYLVPKPPKKNFAKLLKYDDVVLRFGAKLVTDSPEDMEREFVIEYYRSDDTIKIFEVRTPNSGFVGGKFLERSKLKNPETKTWFSPDNFFVGATPIINGFSFKLVSADESTMNHMEGEAECFKYANKEVILKKLADKLWDRNTSRTNTFRLIDSNHDRFISREEFSDMMSMYGWKLNDHELLTIWRCYDENGDGQITADRFFKVLELYKHGVNRED